MEKTKKNSVIYAGQLSKTFSDSVSERVAKKRESARTQAAKVLSNQFASDNKLAASVEERIERDKRINY